MHTTRTNSSFHTGFNDCNDIYSNTKYKNGGTGISGLIRGLATLPPRWIQEPSVVRDRDGRPQEDPLAVYCFCVCSGGSLLRDLLGVSRSRERDLLSVLSIYPRFFLCIFIVYCRILFCYMLMSVDCFGLVVSTCLPFHLATSV